jgi:voltage-gated potassium channel
MVVSLDLRFVRVLRLFRLLRLLKIGRYSESLRTLGGVLKSKKEDLAVSFFALLILLVLISSLLFLFEHDVQPENFPSIPSAMWWGVVTLTTVGYGDVYPVTYAGKILGAFAAVLGIGMFALPAGIVASGFAEALQKRRKVKRFCPHCGEDLDESPVMKPGRTEDPEGEQG